MSEQGQIPQEQTEAVMIVAESAPDTRLMMQQEVDVRSIYVGNVDYTTTPEELEQVFNTYGVVNRITILHDRFTGRPKGYAYIEFVDADAVAPAIEGSNGTLYKERELRVTAKRTNIPGMSKRTRGSNGTGRGGFRGRGRGGSRGGHRGPSETHGEAQESQP
ncbi:hypothetical protein BABINDRAFT_171356 [Babjeviella inositovora NRRL Y-12698]|uniref:RRM domain-containing protein n=1 Tax=Babjeviella inositovora NRRL Y-12698 TaxID=984486 RepID=A0A1E3QPR5_9ASCO|nr:uncharacterized protein BABINDRAFT_171356 [Babjeviella inositovora NRRL Y-12698]ODQ79699.1 hypothetical protein BABINDRAFT_171356 [Babjeviella inositovora NRRL Y-12698]